MRPVYFLGIFIPVAIAVELAHASPTLVFGAAALGVIPCAAVMGEATEAIAARTGPGIGGLLNVTFGNAPELIIAFFALAEGLQEVVKASLVGSIIGNVLLVLGASMIVGGWSREKQVFSRTAASAQSAMLTLAVAALVFPALFQLIHGEPAAAGGSRALGVRQRRGAPLARCGARAARELRVGALLLAQDAPRRLQPVPRPGGRGAPSVVRSSGRRIYLALAAVAVGVMSEILVGSITEASEKIGLSEFFVGVFIVAIVGNAAEHWVAVLVAAKDKMDLAVNIAIGSSAQIALFVAPVLVLLSFVVGDDPLALVFNGYELGALLFAVMIANLVTQDGESNWFEGVQLVSLYAVLGLVFYYA